MNHDPAKPGDDVACKEAVELITGYLEGALPNSERRRLETHLKSCPGCAEYLAQMKTVAGSLGGLREEIPSELRGLLIDSFHDRR